MSNPSCSCSIAVVELRTFILLVLGWVGMASAQDSPVLTLSLDRDSVAVGEPLTLSLTSDEPLEGGRRWQWPVLSPGDSLAQGWEILSVSPLDSSTSPLLDAGMRRQQTVVVMAWDTGLKIIEPLALMDSGRVAARTEARLVDIGIVPMEAEATPRPMQGFKAYQWTWWERLMHALPWVLGIFGALALGWWAYRRWRDRPVHADVTEHEAVPSIPAHEQALTMLRALEQDAPWLRGEGKEAQATVSEAVRLHLQGSFGVKALERTTDELARSLESVPVKGMDREECGWVVDLLRRSDLVKFAKQDLDGDAHLRVIRECIAWVERTSPIIGKQSGSDSDSNGEADQSLVEHG